MMNKYFVAALMLLMGALAVSCGQPKETDRPKTGPLQSPIDQPAFDSPLTNFVPGELRFPGKIAFHSDRSGVLQIYVMRGNTGDVAPLTEGAIQAFEPNWSPDCQSLAFTFGRGGNDDFDIYTMQADGSAKTLLFENPLSFLFSVSLEAATGPTGSELISALDAGEVPDQLRERFESIQIPLPQLDAEATPGTGVQWQFRVQEAGKEWQIKVDGNDYLIFKEDQAINVYKDPKIDDWSPAWSPQGDVIAYQNSDVGIMNVCFVDADGTNQRCLESGPFSNATPSWSPDGTRVLFVSNRDGGDWDVFVKEMVGDGAPVQLTQNSTNDFHPRFSPDGRFIVFASEDPLTFGYAHIFVMNSDGTNEIQLTSRPTRDVTPHWLGNDQIMYASQSRPDASNSALLLMNLDGSGTRLLVPEGGLNKGPVWCPSD